MALGAVGVATGAVGPLTSGGAEGTAAGALTAAGGLVGSVGAATAAKLLEQSIVPLVEVVSLSARETLAALKAAEARGARGGAVYDLLHLVAARKARADAVVTLNGRDFQALAISGDPRIQAP